MKSLYKNIVQGLALSTIVMSLLFLAACEDDNEASGEVVLLNFGPSGVHHGDEITFYGKNLDKVSSIVFQPAVEVPKSAFISPSKDRFNVIIPHAAQAGKVILKTSSGDIESKTILNFEVPVVISSVTPEAKPGTNITITGDKLNWIESITFTSDLVVESADFVSQTLTSLEVTVPMEAQTGFLIFSTGGTEPLTFGTEEQLIVTLPVVGGVNPTSIRHTDNLTITGTDLDLITEIVFAGDASVLKADFISSSETEIVVSVPATTVKGKLTLKQASPVDVVTDGELTIILPIGTDVSPKPAVPGTDNITITGTDLDLVAELGFPTVASPVSASSFVSQSATQIVVLVPAGSKSGSITYKTIHDFEGSLGVNVVVPGAGPPPLAVTMFDEGAAFGGGNWSWGGTADPASTEQAHSGDISFKHTTSGGDGGASIGGMSGIDVTGLAAQGGVLKFSLFGGPGTNGKQAAAILGSDGGDKWDSYNSVEVVEGTWTEYSIPMANYPTVNFANVTRWIIKVEGATDALVYVDRVGFDPPGPPPLGITLYDETIGFDGGNWSWGGTAEVESTEEAYVGDKSFKFVSPADGGASVGGMTAVDANGMNFFSFSIYGGAGTDGKQLAVILNDDWGAYNSVTLVEGEWTEYQIPLTQYASVDISAIVRWALKVETSDGSTIYIDRVGFEE